MKNSLALKIIICVFVCLAVGGLSGYATSDAIGSWYADLNKPFFNPPGWVFGPVWTMLYTLMGVSTAMIWHKGLNTPGVKKALMVFSIHLALNFFWSIIFFGLEQPFWALIEILFLLASIIAFTVYYYRIKPVTAWLQIPYILWVSFATVLNASIVYLN